MRGRSAEIFSRLKALFNRKKVSRLELSESAAKFYTPWQQEVMMRAAMRQERVKGYEISPGKPVIITSSDTKVIDASLPANNFPSEPE